MKRSDRQVEQQRAHAESQPSHPVQRPGLQLPLRSVQAAHHPRRHLLGGLHRAGWLPGYPQVAGGVVVDRGVHSTWAHQGDADVLSASLCLQTAHQTVHAPLRRDIGAHVGHGDITEQRSQEHDVSTALTAELAQGRTGDVGRAAQIGVVGRIEHLRRHLFEAPVCDHGGGVYDAIQPSELLGCQCERTIHGLGVANVCSHRQHLRTAVAALRRHLLQAGFIPGHQHQPRTRPGQPAGGGQPDAAGGTGEQVGRHCGIYPGGPAEYAGQLSRFTRECLKQCPV